jgi:predicted RNase H-like HicB family nuclease
MRRTLSVPLQLTAEVYEIEGSGYWAEVPRFPGCVAQAETIEALKENLIEALEDWLYGSSVKTEEEVRRLAEIQGRGEPVDTSLPQPYGYRPPPSWVDGDE